MITITLGYLTIPFDIIKSVKTLPSNDYVISNTTLCIQGFIQSPPVMYPTIERHVLQFPPQASSTENETCQALYQAFCKHQKQVYAIIPLPSMLGIMAATGQKDIFTFQLVEHVTSIESMQEKIPDLDSSIKPAEILKLCPSWPESKVQMGRLANQIYNTALIYGYWENWQVFEGICERYAIAPQQFIGK